MFDFIPIESYTAVYFNVLMIVAIITLFHAYQYDVFDYSAESFSRNIGFIILVFVILYMGTRPINNMFGDMSTYSAMYKIIEQGGIIPVKRDFLFNKFMVFCARYMSNYYFFLLCAVLYILPCYIFSKKYFGIYWYYVFFIFVGSYMFWPFGTNGIRNGLGTAIFILSLCFYNRKILMYPLMALSFGMHNSLLIPIAAFIVSGIYKNPKVYLYIWLASIPLSLVGGSFWENFFGAIDIGGDSRVEDYLTKANENRAQFAYTGFRWDFLFYSSFAVFAGWYFIFKKEVADKFYIHLWGIYMIANAFWILVIRANYSNRFAYLSWFLMAPIIAYPMLKYKIWNSQYRIVGVVIAIYYLFTYFMFLKES